LHGGVVTGLPNTGANYIGAGSPFSPSSGNTASTGGSANLAASVKFNVCIWL
jgi:hypothetical protein